MVKFVRRRKSVVKRTGVRLNPKAVMSIVHNSGLKGMKTNKLQRWYKHSTLLFCGSLVTPQGFAFSFKLSDLPNYTELQAVYGFYCITKIEAHIETVGTRQLASGVNAQLSQLYYCVDFADAVTPTEAVMLERANTRVVTSLHDLKIVLKPRVASEFISGVGSGLGIGQAGQWISTNTADVFHYGLKFVVTPGTTIFSTQWAVHFKYFMEFKQIK